MRYWIFDGRDAQGPFTEEELRRQPDFSLETLICPDGAADANQWKPARQYLPANPPAAKPAAKPVPAAQPPMGASPTPERSDGVPFRAAAGPMARGPMSKPAAAETVASGMGKMGQLKPEAEVAGESPEALRRRQAQALPARRAPEPEPVPEEPAPPPPDKRGEMLKKAAMAAAALSLMAAGFLGGRTILQRRAAAKAALPLPAASAANGPAGQEDVSAGTKPEAAPAGDVAIAAVKSFPLQSKSRKRPGDPVDALTQKNWRSATTLGDLFDQYGLEALALEAAASAERQGHTIAEGEKELRRSPQLWARRAQKFLAKSAPGYSVELNGMIWRVMVSLPTRPGEPAHRFDVDLTARTLRPVDQLSWFDVDPKEAARWGGKYLRMSEEPDQPEGGGPQTPAYRLPGVGKAAAVASAKPAPTPSSSSDPNDDEDYSDPDEAPKKPAARASAPTLKGSPSLRSGERSPRVAARPAPRPEPKPAAEETYDDPGQDDAKGVQTIFSEADNPNRAPKPLSADAPSRAPEPAARPEQAPVQRPPLPALGDLPPSRPQPNGAGTIMTPQPAGGAKGKSVTDMSVDELQKYLNRDKK